jgi:hypothetical protein
MQQAIMTPLAATMADFDDVASNEGGMNEDRAITASQAREGFALVSTPHVTLVSTGLSLTSLRLVVVPLVPASA